MLQQQTLRPSGLGRTHADHERVANYHEAPGPNTTLSKHALNIAAAPTGIVWNQEGMGRPVGGVLEKAKQGADPVECGAHLEKLVQHLTTTSLSIWLDFRGTALVHFEAQDPLYQHRCSITNLSYAKEVTT